MGLLKNRYFLFLFTVFTFLNYQTGFGWDLPDKTWIAGKMPPAYWEKTGGIQVRGGYFLQRYNLFQAGGQYQNSFRIAVIWPVKDKFCAEVLPPDKEVESFHESCAAPVPDNAVNIKVKIALYSP